MKTIFLISLCVSCVLGFILHEGLFADELANKIVSAKKEDRSLAYKKIIEERKERINRLIEIVKSPIPVNNGEENKMWAASKELAIKILGELRATEAVSVLIENVDFLTYLVSEEILPEDDYPATMALSKIGMPAIKPCLIAIENGHKESFLLMRTVLKIFDYDDDIIRSVVNQRIKTLTKQQALSKVERLKDAFKECLMSNEKDKKAK